MLQARAFLFLVALMLVPLSSAQDGGGEGNGRGDDADSSGRGRGESEQTGPDEQGPDSIDLEAAGEGNHARLDWVMHGRAHRVQAFNIYRSDNGGPAELVASVESGARSFVDSQLPPVGTYTYMVEAAMTDGTTTQSNQSATLIGGGATCEWISVAPTGNPPIIFHEECSPFYP